MRVIHHKAFYISLIARSHVADEDSGLFLRRDCNCAAILGNFREFLFLPSFKCSSNQDFISKFQKFTLLFDFLLKCLYFSHIILVCLLPPSCVIEMYPWGKAVHRQPCVPTRKKSQYYWQITKKQNDGEQKTILELALRLCTSYSPWKKSRTEGGNGRWIIFTDTGRKLTPRTGP